MSSISITYPHRSAGHCGSGALRDLVEWAGTDLGAPPDEALVFGLGGGLSFTYLRSDAQVPPIYLVGRNREMELDFCRRLGIVADQQQTEDDDVAWERVRSGLEAGRPVMVLADIGELPYLRVRLHNTRHVVVVVGHDPDRDTVDVVDNDRPDVQTIPRAALAAAMNSDAFPGPNRNTTFDLRFPRSIGSLIGRARDAAASAADHLEGGTGTLFEPEAFGPLAVAAVGVDGVEEFVADLATWDEALGDRVPDAVAALGIFIEKAGTGGGLFRRLQAGFCRAVAEATQDADFDRAGAAWEATAAAWTELAHRCRDRAPVSALVEAARPLPGLERTAAAALRRAASAPADGTRASAAQAKASSSPASTPSPAQP